MESSSVVNLLTFLEDSQIVLLAKDKREQVSRGLLCPDTEFITLTFRLSSDVLGQAT